MASYGDITPIHKQLDSGTDSRVDTVLVNSNPLRSGELARLTGVSADTLRHYEKLGILPTSQRTNGGYRMFPPSSVERVRLAQRALQVGFSLSELWEILVSTVDFRFARYSRVIAGNVRIFARQLLIS